MQRGDASASLSVAGGSPELRKGPRQARSQAAAYGLLRAWQSRKHERMKPKRRLSASVDDDLIRAAEAAAKRGDVPTVSAWVNDALRAKLEQEQRLRALASFVRSFEAEHGEITQAEMEQAARRARARAQPSSTSITIRDAITEVRARATSPRCALRSSSIRTKRSA